MTASAPAAPLSQPGPTIGQRVRDAGNALLVPLLAVFTALVVGALIIVFTDPRLLQLWFSEPLKALQESISTVASAYGALLTGSLGDPREIVAALQSGDSRAIAQAFVPISETIVQATPLIFAGLAVAVGFRSGLFNIGAEGQLYVGALVAVFVGFTLTDVPWFIHLPLAVLAGFIGGGLYGLIAGFLKARTGANEVIVTIMLNYIAYRLVDLALQSSIYQRPGRDDPISKTVATSAQFPQFFDNPSLRANWAFVLALVAAAAVSWLLFRSVKGFEFRAVGLNPIAARYAGMNIGLTIMLTMFISGGLAGLAGTQYVLGASGTLTPAFSPGWGFDAIAIALLGKSRPLGVVLAALLFGALRAGATPMQAATGIPIDIVFVIQALVIMFVAAPALIRAIYHIRTEPVSGFETFTKGWGA
jgi:general nucleoside transport system permease protein